MTFARSIIAADLSINRLDMAAACTVQRMARPAGFYRDTAHRRSLRALLSGAGLSGAQVKLAFFKTNDELRYMLCLPVADADPTAQYVTVQDLELSAERERKVFRRVNLDTVVKLEVVYSPAGVQ